MPRLANSWIVADEGVAHELVGGTAVFLSTPAAHFLSGRFVTANWDMEELVQRQDEIVREDKLRMFCKGQFGPQQFQ